MKEEVAACTPTPLATNIHAPKPMSTLTQTTTPTATATTTTPKPITKTVTSTTMIKKPMVSPQELKKALPSIEEFLTRFRNHTMTLKDIEALVSCFSDTVDYDLDQLILWRSRFINRNGIAWIFDHVDHLLQTLRYFFYVYHVLIENIGVLFEQIKKSRRVVQP